MLDRKVVPKSKYRISRLPSWCCGYDTPEAGSSDVVVSVISSQSFLALRIARRSSCPVDGFSHRCASILSRKFGRVNLKQRAQKKEQNSKFGELKLCLNHCQIRIVEIRLFENFRPKIQPGACRPGMMVTWPGNGGEDSKPHLAC